MSHDETPKPTRITVPGIRARKNGEKIVSVTAYDYLWAQIVDRSGVDIILIGDSAGSVMQGESTTIPVTMDQMIYHSRCVSRAVKHALVVGDMPFLSYQVSVEQAIESAGRFLKEGGVSAVKLEGGKVFQKTVERLVSIDIPVMGHVGLTPQSFHRMGGYKIQGRENRKAIIDDAKALADAGAFSIVIEGVPDDVAQEITASVSVPTIGIGAGLACDGQIIVLQDVLGITEHPAKFVKQFAHLREDAMSALGNFASEVKSGKFPGPEHTYGATKK